jgi:uncharacterized protein (UPF0548 family)
LTKTQFYCTIFSEISEILKMTYSLLKPTEKEIDQFIAEQHDRPISYREAGATRGKLPSGYAIDHNRVCLGYGRETYEQARAALCRWEMFRLDWVQLCWPSTSIETGATVAVLARALGLWSLNACRIIYLIEEKGAMERFGFAYGTLPEHAEQGEERFSIIWDHADDRVWYDILAFSRPRQLPARLGYPYTRALQKRFARDSKQTMVNAIQVYFA